MTASLYGLKIYHEHVRGGLDGAIGNQYATGRFVMSTKHDARKNQFLEINIELRTKVPKNKKTEIRLRNLMLKHLREVNSEFRRLNEAVGDKAIPKIILHPYKSSALFSRHGKQKWRS